MLEQGLSKFGGGRLFVGAGLLLALVLGPAPAARAADLLVDSTIDAADLAPGDGRCAAKGDICTLRAAVQEANAMLGPDDITLPAGTYVLSQHGVDEDTAMGGDLDVKEDLTLTGADSSTTIIDGDNIDRVFDLLPGTTVSIANVTIENGDPHMGFGGGAIRARGESLLLSDAVIRYNRNGGIAGTGNVTVRNSAIYKNRSFAGAAIHIDSHNLLIVENSTVHDNIAASDGGGILGVQVQVNGSAIFDNHAGNRGGGIFAVGGSYVTTGVILHDSAVYGNSAGARGGGIMNNSGMVTLHVSRVFQNYTTNEESYGGGIYNTRIVRLVDSAVIDNRTEGEGGNIYNGNHAGSPRLTISQSEISDGVARIGGGIYNAGALDLTNVTLSGNRADAGGALFNAKAVDPARLGHVTIAGNMAEKTGGGISNFGTLMLGNTLLANNGAAGNCDVAITSLGNNLSSDDSCASSLTDPEDHNGVDPLIAPLASNGGATRTHALLTGSPAVDRAGDKTCLPIDQRGVARPLDGDGDGKVVCDIGAYELEP